MATSRRWTTADIPDQTGRTIIVTGANSGLGKVTAAELAAKGAHVVLACRSLEKAQAAADSMRGSTEVRALDLSDLASIRAFAADLPHERIDVLTTATVEKVLDIDEQSAITAIDRARGSGLLLSADTLVSAFMSGADDEGDDAGADGILGVDELHIVSTEFRSMLSQTANALRIAPMVVEYVGEPETGPHTLYSFEPSAETLFDALLPRYIATRVYAALLEAAASESASRRRAMKSATDNADELIKGLTLAANRERQAQITQEISEIVGGSSALAN